LALDDFRLCAACWTAFVSFSSVALRSVASSSGALARYIRITFPTTLGAPGRWNARI
jgi:hypothetical protein